MSQNKKQPSISSGNCMYCNVFFRRLAAHMLSSETCMLASQESLSNKRVRCEVVNEVSINTTSSNDHIDRVARTLSSQNLSEHISEDCHYSKDYVSMNQTSDLSEHSVGADDSYYNDYDVTENSIHDTLHESIDEIKVMPIDDDMFSRPFTPEEHFMINLCHVCDEANAPLDLVDKVVAVFRDAQSNGLNLESDIVRSREYFLKHLMKRFNVPIPESVNVVIEDNSGNEQTISIVRQIFLSQAMDLIHDHEIWGNENNFKGTVDMDDPFDCYRYGRCDNKVDEVVDGVWYKKTVEECEKIAKGERFVVMGLIFYCDKTGTDVNQRNSLEPFSFTFCLFNRECRYNTAAWRTLGYVPDFDKMSSATHSISRGGYIGKGRTIRNFHKCLEILMDPMFRNQGDITPLYANVRFGDKVAICRVFFPFAYIMGDGLSSDKMCGRYLGYSNVNRLSRVCNIPFALSDDPEYCCQRISMHWLQRKSNKALKLFGLKEFLISDKKPHPSDFKKLQQDVKFELSQVSHHMHNSAFRNVWFGQNTNGITSATPTDLMHAYCHGVLVYVIKILLAPLNNQEKSKLDSICVEML